MVKIQMVETLVISSLALTVSIIAMFLTIRQSRISIETTLTSLLFSQRNKYHNTLHEYWKLSEKEKKSEAWKKIMKLELQAYANIYEYACIKYSHHRIDKRAFKETFYSSIITFYESNWGQRWGVDLHDESTMYYYYLRKVYKEFKDHKHQQKHRKNS